MSGVVGVVCFLIIEACGQTVYLSRDSEVSSDAMSCVNKKSSKQLCSSERLQLNSYSVLTEPTIVLVT